MGKYFGTDGLRGEANQLLTTDLALKVGQYLGYRYRGQKIIIGKDTRLSSDMLEHALAAGIASSGADVYLLGTCATPALAYLITEKGFKAGVMISASHNPFYDNGLKVFGESGMKSSFDLELEIESYIDGTRTIEKANRDVIGNIYDYSDALEDYILHLEDVVKHDFKGLSIVLDLANGSAVSSAQRLFEDLKADVILMNASPNGTNINLDSGSTHIENLQARVLEEKADLGFAFDGDADRCLAVDHKGNIIDGDKIIYVLSKDMIENNQLKDHTVVSTVMANLGFKKSMERENIHVIQTDVGDKHVFKAMVDGSYQLGGEQSGHIILSEYATTGDGVLTALRLAEVVSKNNSSLYDLSKDCLEFPQVLQNITVRNKKEVMGELSLLELIENIEEKLGDAGRILVRPSGTEPLVRVMVEAEDIETCRKYVNEVIEHIEKL